jgi:hypothetical protein
MTMYIKYNHMDLLQLLTSMTSLEMTCKMIKHNFEYYMINIVWRLLRKKTFGQSPNSHQVSIHLNCNKETQHVYLQVEH